MNIADRFVVRLVELCEWHNQMHRAEYYKPKTHIKTSDKNSAKQLKNENCGSKAIGQ
jgi:hypothetical protein